VADLSAAETAREGAVTGGTHEVQARAWRRWTTWTESVGIIDDVFLDGFTQAQRTRLLGGFAMALRDGRYSGSAHQTLVEGTVRNSVSYVAQTFRDNDRSNPTKDSDGELGRVLQRLFRAFRNKDPKPKQQKALPACVISEVKKLRSTEKQRAVGELVVGAFFFACRSCEYVKVPQAEKRRTDVLKLRNISFYRDGIRLDHSDSQLEYADCVSLCFEMQKKDEKWDRVTQLTSEDTILCPVRQWAALTRRILGYPGATPETTVNAVWKNDRIEFITSSDITDALRDGVKAIGEDKLGFKASEVGTHSIRSGAAMAMYLGECPVYTIMMIGRWSSDAFLLYIRKQVEQFSHNVSKRMLKFQFYRHIPDQKPTISHLDPRQRNHPGNAETRRNIGGNAAKQAKLPLFSSFN
jgi:hypothetical protein